MNVRMDEPTGEDSTNGSYSNFLDPETGPQALPTLLLLYFFLGL